MIMNIKITKGDLMGLIVSWKYGHRKLKYNFAMQ